jgi:hypothetical protein
MIILHAQMRSTRPGTRTGSHHLAARLKTLRGKPGYAIDYAINIDIDHDPSAFVALARVIKFAFFGQIE